jgi:hypothetical protein
MDLREVRDRIIERDHELLLMLNGGSHKIRPKPQHKQAKRGRSK